MSIFPKAKTPPASSSATGPSSSGDAAWLDPILADQKKLAVELGRRNALTLERIAAAGRDEQTPGSPTPGWIKDWPAGTYSGDAKQFPDQEQARLAQLEGLKMIPRPGDALDDDALDASLERIEHMAAWERDLLGYEEPYPHGAKELYDRVTGDASFADYAGEIYAGLHTLLVTKQADYGPHAINRAPGGALNGIHVRMHDKLERAIHLEGRDVNHESLVDTYRDLANYAVIAVMVLDGTWPQ